MPLDELVGETVEAMRVQADARHVEVRAELPPGLRPARGDPEKLQRVLFNLIQNAIRHTPADGSVVVRAEPAGDAVEIEVADSGGGIAGADRDRVFEPFFRGGAERRGRATAPGSAWRSRARSSRPTAAGSGSRTPRPARACASRSRRAVRQLACGG